MRRLGGPAVAQPQRFALARGEIPNGGDDEPADLRGSVTPDRPTEGGSEAGQ